MTIFNPIDKYFQQIGKEFEEMNRKERRVYKRWLVKNRLWELGVIYSRRWPSGQRVRF